MADPIFHFFSSLRREFQALLDHHLIVLKYRHSETMATNPGAQHFSGRHGELFQRFLTGGTIIQAPLYQYKRPDYQ